MSQPNLTLSSILATLMDETPGIDKQASAKEPVAQPSQVESSTQQDLEALLKQANTNEVNLEMSNANEKGRAIAESVLALVKKAMDGSAGGNQVVNQTSAQISHSSAGLVETPREGASITQTLQGLVANGIANGAVRPDALDEHLDRGGDEGNAGQAGMASSDGHSVDALPEQDDDEVEKTAALITLVDQGVDFDTAVSLIKQAEQEIFAEEFEHTKQAAVAALLDEGWNIESAVQLVKVAMDVDSDQVKQAMYGGMRGVVGGAQAVGNAIGNAPRAIGGAGHDGLEAPRGVAAVGAAASKLKGSVDAHAVAAGQDARALFSANKGIGPASRKAAALGLAKNPLVLGGLAAAGATGGAIYALSGNEKKAEALQYLVGEGYSVSQALDILDNQ